MSSQHICATNSPSKSLLKKTGDMSGNETTTSTTNPPKFAATADPWFDLFPLKLTYIFSDLLIFPCSHDLLQTMRNTYIYILCNKNPPILLPTTPITKPISWFCWVGDSQSSTSVSFWARRAQLDGGSVPCDCRVTNHSQHRISKRSQNQIAHSRSRNFRTTSANRWNQKCW